MVYHILLPYHHINSDFNVNLTLELLATLLPGEGCAGHGALARAQGEGGASLTPELESDLLSALEPESAYSAFKLKPGFLSLAPLQQGDARGAEAAARGGRAREPTLA